jgi:hypothetical protein
MRLRWFEYLAGSAEAIHHPTAIMSSDGRHATVLQYWDASGFGYETVDGEHGSWVDVPRVFAEAVSGR